MGQYMENVGGRNLSGSFDYIVLIVIESDYNQLVILSDGIRNETHRFF